MKLSLSRVCAVAAVGLAAGGAFARPDLVENGPFITSATGGAGGAPLSALQTSLGGTSYGYNHQMVAPSWRLTDDFVVTAPAGWNLSSVVVFAFRTNSGTAATPFTHLNLRIWSGRPGDSTSTVLFGDSTTNRLASSAWTGCYRASVADPLGTTRPIYANEAAVNPPLHLNPGTYWLDWQASSNNNLVLGVPVTYQDQMGAPNANARKFESQTGQWTTLRDGGNFAAQEMAFIVRGTVGPGGGPVCYANCDSSTAAPFLNINDYVCFANRFAAADSRANCDASTAAPLLNVNDFVCFTNRFSAGCAAP